MPTYRVVYKDDSGKVCHKDFKTVAALLAEHEQIGIEEDSYTIRLHGEPVLKGLVGPLSEGKTIVRYETPDVFTVLTEEWAKQRRNGRGKSFLDEDSP